MFVNGLRPRPPRADILWMAIFCLLASGLASNAGAWSPDAIHVAVMDPLCNRLACDCVGGYAQRDYDRFARFLEEQLGRPVMVTYAESLLGPNTPPPEQLDLIIGKSSLVAYDAHRSRLSVRLLAMLSDREGRISQEGMFVVRQDDPARSVADLIGRRILFGPEESVEKHAAAFAALDVFGLPIPAAPSVDSSCSTAAVAVVEHEADAAVVSGYAMPLLQGCGTIDQGALRVVGKTSAVPFIGVFSTGRLSAERERAFQSALQKAGTDRELLEALESRDGFVRVCGPGGEENASGWTDWRGPKRNAISRHVPRQLPRTAELLWSRVLTGHGLSGLAVKDRYLIVADKSLDGRKDIFRCLDSMSGQEFWKLEYAAAGKMDFTNAPRATPVIHDGQVYLLGAFGDLHSVALATGKIRWRRHLASDFSTGVPTWGFCSTPLVVGDKLVVNPGAEDASIAALDLQTGSTRWVTAGDPPGYSSLIEASVRGQQQVIGYEAAALCGWDPRDGQRLWRLVPEYEGDFNVPTPIMVGNRLLVSTENNGTRLYDFDNRGHIRPEPIAQNNDLSPDTSTPVVLGSIVLGSAGGLICLSVEDQLKTLWECFDDPYMEYCCLLAGNDRFLVLTQTGSLRLLKADKNRLHVVSTVDLFGNVPSDDRDVWSHPALVSGRLYVRNSLGVYCFLIPQARQ